MGEAWDETRHFWRDKQRAGGWGVQVVRLHGAAKECLLGVNKWNKNDSLLEMLNCTLSGFKGPSKAPVIIY